MPCSPQSCWKASFVDSSRQRQTGWLSAQSDSLSAASTPSRSHASDSKTARLGCWPSCYSPSASSSRPTRSSRPLGSSSCSVGRWRSDLATTRWQFVSAGTSSPSGPSPNCSPWTRPNYRRSRSRTRWRPRWGDQPHTCWESRSSTRSVGGSAAHRRRCQALTANSRWLRRTPGRRPGSRWCFWDWSFRGAGLSVAWAVLGLAFVGVGLALDARSRRLQGVVVLGLVTTKVFLYDTQGLDTLARTLSFLVLGGILLVASYAYARWQGEEPLRRLSGEQPPRSAESEHGRHKGFCRSLPSHRL
ncbi:DUF2339 domain-containing protein [Haloarcula sp. CBA1122]|uniref:DUF2339 domain-containing protein n=1 Tax=Haloarcula sp. CBA1122 TaxID=2668069 RepID=UPI0020912076|nr:DUF2339 domain-containing protein [Haloarcula sp. CBA1122]